MCPREDIEQVGWYEPLAELLIAPEMYTEKDERLYFAEPWLAPLNGLDKSRVQFTHFKKRRHHLLIHPPEWSGRKIITMGSTQRGRWMAHHRNFPNAYVEWVGMCTYATQFAVKGANPMLESHVLAEDGGLINIGGIYGDTPCSAWPHVIRNVFLLNTMCEFEPAEEETTWVVLTYLGKPEAPLHERVAHIVKLRKFFGKIDIDTIV